MGQESVALGFLGGATGLQLERGLHAAGIATDFTWIEAETRTNVVIQEASTGRHVKVNESGPLILQAFQENLLAKVSQLAREGDWWAFCGSLPPGVDAGFYAQLVRRVMEQGGRPCLDTSGEALRLGCHAAPYLVKPNRLEAGELAGFPLDSASALQQAASQFLDSGIQLAAISLGKDGLWLADRTQSLHAVPPQVEVIGAAVGAGDALLAGLLWALNRDMGLAETARWGVAAGTAAALLPGVQMGSLAEIEQIFERVVVLDA
jgi:1-phosphofructokinase family hexose kinase